MHAYSRCPLGAKGTKGETQGTLPIPLFTEVARCAAHAGEKSQGDATPVAHMGFGRGSCAKIALLGHRIHVFSAFMIGIR